MWNNSAVTELIQFGGLVAFAVAAAVVIIYLARWASRKDSVMEALSRLAKGWPIRSPKNQRRANVLREPFPDEWLEYLDDNVRVYQFLTHSEQHQVQEIVQVFIAEKQWEGCGGLAMTDEIKVTIASQASLLLLGIEHDYFKHVQSVLVYPSAFSIPAGQRQQDGFMTEQVAALGEAWYRGPVILAWDDALAGCRGENHGQNVVLHEFAHQLDFQGNWGNNNRHKWQHWREVMASEYHQLIRAAEQGRPTLLDQYGAGSPEEFFAVVTECFFEQPIMMEQIHPHLYEVVRDFYGQDPAQRLAGAI